MWDRDHLGKTSEDRPLELRRVLGSATGLPSLSERNRPSVQARIFGCSCPDDRSLSETSGGFPMTVTLLDSVRTFVRRVQRDPPPYPQCLALDPSTGWIHVFSSRGQYFHQKPRRGFLLIYPGYEGYAIGLVGRTRGHWLSQIPFEHLEAVCLAALTHSQYFLKRLRGCQQFAPWKVKVRHPSLFGKPKKPRVRTGVQR